MLTVSVCEVGGDWVYARDYRLLLCSLSLFGVSYPRILLLLECKAAGMGQTGLWDSYNQVLPEMSLELW